MLINDFFDNGGSSVQPLRFEVIIDGTSDGLSGFSSLHQRQPTLFACSPSNQRPKTGRHKPIPAHEIAFERFIFCLHCDQKGRHPKRLFYHEQLHLFNLINHPFSTTPSWTQVGNKQETRTRCEIDVDSVPGLRFRRGHQVDLIMIRTTLYCWTGVERSAEWWRAECNVRHNWVRSLIAVLGSYNWCTYCKVGIN